VTGQALPVLGVASVAVRLGGVVLQHDCLVVADSLLLNTQGLIGMDDLSRARAVIDIGAAPLRVAGETLPLELEEELQGSGTMGVRVMARTTGTEVLAVRLREDCVLPPQCELLCTGVHERLESGPVVLEPALFDARLD